MKKTCPYGTWKTSLSAKDLTTNAIRLSFPQKKGGRLLWQEMRPEEKGRTVLVSEEGDLLPKNISARTKVHEYGGISYLINNDQVFFSDAKDQRLYELTDKIRPVTAPADVRYADGSLDPKTGRLYYVREDHREEEVKNTLVLIDPERETLGHIVASGYDFYSSPRVSDDGQFLTYLAWNHPQMPWDGTKLFLHEIKKDGSLEKGIVVAGGEKESIFQPRFSPENDLYFVSDKEGYWNLYRFKNQKVRNICPKDAEFGLPAWLFGFSTYDFFGTDIICSYIENGVGKLAHLSLKNFTLTPFDLPFTSYNDLSISEEEVYFTAASPEEFSSLIRFFPKTGEYEVFKKSRDYSFPKGSISIGQSVTFPTEDGEKAHGFFYPPINPDFIGPESERPPLIVKVHGGPTGFESNVLNLEIQFWTQRGFAYAIVNFGGSTGYGKKYRERLRGNWGIVDVNDSCSMVLHLAKEGLIDRDRVVIKGGSSGGYTALAALCFRDVFAAGVSSYGISDLEALAEETHKFEARYNDSLIGEKHLYKERSPIHHIEKIQVPVLLFQGSEDKIVLPNQSEKMHEELQKRGIPSKYILFEGEGHGFRMAKTLETVLREEHAFYREIFL